MLTYTVTGATRKQLWQAYEAAERHDLTLVARYRWTRRGWKRDLELSTEIGRANSLSQAVAETVS